MITPDWKSFKHAVLEEKECFIKIVDGIKEAMELFKDYLEQKFIAQGYYIVEKNPIEIKDPDTFSLPYVMYPKLYDEVKNLIYELLRMEHNYHILVTSHWFGESDAKERLQEDIFRKFDTVIELKASKEETPTWWAIIHKNRGREKAGVSNVIRGNLTEKLLTIWQKVI